MSRRSPARLQRWRKNESEGSGGGSRAKPAVARAADRWSRSHLRRHGISRLWWTPCRRSGPRKFANGSTRHWRRLMRQACPPVAIQIPRNLPIANLVCRKLRLGVACPFLEKESCSIHRDRPLVCREYLVTSPPAACAEPGSGQIRQVNIPVTVWSVFGRSVSADGSLEWMPLVEALRYAASIKCRPQQNRT